MRITARTHRRDRSIHFGVILEGAVKPAEGAYAIDQLRTLIGESSRPIVKVRAHLCGATSEEWAVADCIIFIADDTLVIGGAAAEGVPAAVNELVSRIAPRLHPNRRDTS
jgi:hypothetical protein